jgi:hypothetical protein
MTREVHEFVPLTNSWKKVEPTFAVTQLRWRSHFNALVDHEEASLTMALQHDPSSAMNLVGELSALLAQKGVNTVGSFIDTKKEELKANQLFSVFNIFPWFSSGMIILVLRLIGMALGLLFGRKSACLSTLSRRRHTWPIPQTPPNQPSVSYDTSSVNFRMEKASSSDGKVVHSAVSPLPKRSVQVIHLRKQPHKILACPTMTDKAAGTSDAIDNIVRHHEPCFNI